MKYSKELRERKIKGFSAPASQSVSDAREMLKKFCTAEDIVGVPLEDFYELFNKFCEEEGKCIYNRKMLGRLVHEIFGVKSVISHEPKTKRAFRVYIKDECMGELK